ncbi:MAG TPA: hypothetical protein VGB95_01220, partial [Chitinophagales bacterium]
MNEIICPHCGKAFKIDEAGYADILKQVRDHSFEEELKSRVGNAVELAEAKIKNSLQELIANKDKELAQKNNDITVLRAKNSIEFTNQLKE